MSTSKIILVQKSVNNVSKNLLFRNRFRSALTLFWLQWRGLMTLMMNRTSTKLHFSNLLAKWSLHLTIWMWEMFRGSWEKYRNVMKLVENCWEMVLFHNNIQSIFLNKSKLEYCQLFLQCFDSITWTKPTNAHQNWQISWQKCRNGIKLFENCWQMVPFCNDVQDIFTNRSEVVYHQLVFEKSHYQNQQQLMKNWQTVGKNSKTEN